MDIGITRYNQDVAILLENFDDEMIYEFIYTLEHNIMVFPWPNRFHCSITEDYYDEYQKSIRNNLELLAENVRKNSQTSTSSITTAVGGFNYDNQNLNKAFSSNKNQNKFYDPTNQKVKKFGGRVNKRGNNFNAAASISRSRNNQSSSFKK